MFRTALLQASIAVGLALGLSRTEAQQRPPSAAPTSTVQVNALPLVRPEGEALDDFLSGLAAGLMKANHVPGMAIAVVKNGDVLVEKGFGANGNSNVDALTSAFRLGMLSGLMTDVAALQLVEQARVLTDEDVGAALGENDRHVTISDLLTGRNDSVMLDAVVAKVSGQPIASYIQDHLFMPLGMAHSSFDNAGLTTTAGDMSRFMLALLNGGEYEIARVLSSESITQMESTQFTFHPALAGLTYGFAELRRNGWRGVQRDGKAPGFQARLVLVPEAHTGYFIAINTKAGAKFWRELDNALFGRLFPTKAEVASALLGAAPTAGDARVANGVYALREGFDVLRTDNRHLDVDARADGALVLTGAEDNTLLPQAGGYWRSDAGDMRAAYKDGVLYLDARVFKRVPWWMRVPLWVMVLAAFVGLALLGFGAYRIARL